MRGASLFVRYWALLALLVSLPLVAVGAIVGHAAWNESRQGALDRQGLEARRLALQVERHLLPVIDRLSLVASLPWGYPSATRPEFEAEARRIVIQHPLVDRIQRVDARGGIEAHFAQDGRRRTLAADEIAAVAQPRPPGEKPPVVRVVSRGAPGAWSVVIPERSGDHRIVADLRVEVIGDWTAPSGDAGEIHVVVDPRGVLIAHPELSWVEARRSIDELPGWSAISRTLASSGGASEGSFDDVDVEVTADPSRGRNWFGAWRRIEPVGWTVVSLAPASPLKARMRGAVARAVLVLAIANTLAVMLAWFLAKRLTDPIGAIARASGRVAAGDLDARAEVAGEGPVAKLASQFNAMVDELRASYATLEQRVTAKTAELDAANRHKSAFLAQMSHELRTPLNAVIGFSTSLRAQYFGPLNDKQREYVGYILSSGQHLLALINDLLDLSKIEAGRMDLAIENVDVPGLVASSVELLRIRAHQKNVDLQVAVDDAARTVRADGRKLKQVLLNLLSNAVKYTPPGGHIEVRAERVASPLAGVRMAVIDTGPGIAAEHAGRLFEDFGQVPGSDDAAVEGTGLGLAVSRRLVELHGGRIGVESAPGKGSTFWFVVPERA
jgi:signal transduction histidine kinase